MNGTQVANVRHQRYRRKAGSAVMRLVSNGAGNVRGVRRDPANAADKAVVPIAEVAELLGLMGRARLLAGLGAPAVA